MKNFDSLPKIFGGGYYLRKVYPSIPLRWAA